MKPFFRYVLRQAVLVNLLFVLAMAVGLFSLFDLPVERYPDVHMGKVQINTVLPGMKLKRPWTTWSLWSSSAPPLTVNDR
jgi:multidrug efflux pump subunit AcrB